MSLLYRWYRSVRVYLQGYEIDFQASNSNFNVNCNEAETNTDNKSDNEDDNNEESKVQTKNKRCRRSISATTLATSNISQDDERRIIYVNHPINIGQQTNFERFCSNRISTGKYTLISFLPLFLFEQFRRWANIFFLIIAVLQQIPDVSPTGRYTTLVPLLFILSVSALKEIIEDFKRHRADDETNERDVEILVNECWSSVKWYQVQVGDIVRITNNNFFPADLLLLASSEPKSISFIETANLDGETNLKIRQGLVSTSSLKNISELVRFSAIVECEQPNRHLYEFNGILKEADKQFQILTHDQILLRGAVLRNTSWIFALVIYTGHDTKLMRNSTKAPLKRSTVDKLTNNQILMLFSILLVMCVISAIFSEIWTNQHKNTDWYLDLNNILSQNFLFNLLTFMILYNNLIPISLQVTLELVRFIQAIFINMDIEMYDSETDTPALARTSNLNEELGLVKYVFSDKTGTLTRNIMEFKKCVIGSELFYVCDNYLDSDLVKKISNDDISDNEKQIFKEFLTLLVICNTVIPEIKGSDIHYYAASPDERALVTGASRFGYRFLSRTPTSVEIDALGVRESYEVLSVLEFTSKRKRMSVIAKDANNNIKLYCKGADNVIYERLSPQGRQNADIIVKYLEKFGVQGFRTLCCASVNIESEEYDSWHKKYMKAMSSITNREKELEEVSDLIETNLTLLGATAIEDKLQIGVPETIKALLKADIHVWILTGDKQETAINIGYSCRLLSSNMPLMILNENSLDDTRDAIQRYSSDLGDNLGQDNEVALVIDGRSLKYALSHSLQSDFVLLCISCKAVICCRVSPIQKAEVVDLVSRNTKSVTLAIGDGANDVAMIQKANVGIGISGQEGLQAASASDYSISQFRFLVRLLFVHGAWNYTRMSKLILYSFYKNICLYVIELWFAIYSGWSGQVLFERWSIGLYNVVFTALPPLVIGIFDKVSLEDDMLKNPQLYKTSQSERSFNTKVFWIWIFNALIHSILLFWLSLYICNEGILWENSREGGYLVTGNFVYTFVVITVCLKAGLIMNFWTYMTHCAIYGSTLLWFLFIIIYSYVWPTVNIGSVMVGMSSMIFSSPVFWLGIVIVPVMVLTLDVLVYVISNTINANSKKSVQNNKHINDLNIARSDTNNQSNSQETTRLLRGAGILQNVRNVFTRRSHHRSDLDLELTHGYAFSQEEGAKVSQTDIIRAYNTNIPKPNGF